MNNTANNQTNDEICKKNPRLQKNERDLYRVCPSKLCKRELENLYFALLDNNVELKKNLHSQQDKLKVLSTKLQRMAVMQKTALCKENCGCNSKMTVIQQKEIIADLQKENEQMKDRIRQLSMRLCSAKQFLKRSPGPGPKCPRCNFCTGPMKNSSFIALEARQSQDKVTAASSPYIPINISEEPKSTEDVAMQTEGDEIEDIEKQCNENKSRNVMDELKQKIVNLQEELSNTHDEYSKRISKLESDVRELRRENGEVRSARGASEHALQHEQERGDELRERLAQAEGKLNDVEVQLTIEKKKVTELETILKLSTTSSEVMRIMEKLNTPKMATSGSVSSYYSLKQSESRAPSLSHTKSDHKHGQPATSLNIKGDDQFPKSDDSGFTDLNKSTEADDSKASYLERLNQEMSRKISALQLQLDDLRKKAARHSPEVDETEPSELELFDDERQMVVITVADPTLVVEIEELDVIKNYSKKEKDIDTSSPFQASHLATTYTTTPNKSGDVVSTYSTSPIKDGAASSYAPQPMKDGHSIDTYTPIPIKDSNDTRPYTTAPVKDDDGTRPYTSTPVEDDDGTRHYTFTSVKDDDGTRPYTSTPVKDGDGTKPYTSTPVKDDDGTKPYTSTPVKDDDGTKPYTSTPVKDDDGTKPYTSTPVKDGDDTNLYWSTPIKEDHVVNTPKHSNSVIKKSWNEFVKDMDGNSYKNEEIGTPSTSYQTNLDETKPIESRSKRDEDYRQQIPGPIPTTYQPYNEKKKPQKHRKTSRVPMNNDFKSDLVSPKSETSIKIVEPSNTSQKIKIVDPNEPITTKAQKLNDDTTTPNNINKESSNTKEKAPAEYLKTVVTKAKHDKSSAEELAEVKKESLLSDVNQSTTIVTPESTSLQSNAEGQSPNAQADNAKNESVYGPPKEFEQCLSRATICRCPRAPRRDINMFRTCSGTLCFHTSGPEDMYKPCDCAPTVDTDMPKEMEQWPPAAPLKATTMVSSRMTPSQAVTTAPSASRTEPEATQTMPSPAHSALHSAEYTTVPPRRASVKYTEQNRRDSATYTEVPPRRDSATYTAVPPRRDSATYTGLPPRRDPATYTGLPPRRDSATYTGLPPRRDSATYTGVPPRRDSTPYAAMVPRQHLATSVKPPEINNVYKYAGGRASSSANTERDVSSLSDLPPEREDKSPRSSPLVSPRYVPSPGEEKATSTYTDDTRSYDYGPLSEGEVPTHASGARPRKLSFGEQPNYSRPAPVPASTDAQMEATLNAISEELAHCRRLLASARAHEVESPSVGAEGSRGGGRAQEERVHQLHATPATHRVSDAAAHNAIFTLHIGTLVLSDEAVLRSRDKSLVLTWQFYEQPAATVRMRTGRVVFFDFSTEYDAAFDDHFLDYLKKEEMSLKICDVNNMKEPFASCALPLRDALINTDRRVDMSLAVVAGEAHRRWGGAGADPLVAGDELGVLDLWYCLRVPPPLHHHIYNSIARSTAEPRGKQQGVGATSAAIDMQSVDDEQENRMSQEIFIGPRTAHGLRTIQDRRNTGPEIPSLIGRDWSFDRPSTAPPSLLDVRNSNTLDPVRTRQLSLQTRKSFGLEQQMGERRWPNIRRRSSAMISKEVPAMVKSPPEMKRAVDRNFQGLGKHPRTDDEVYQGQSSMSSLRLAAAEQRIQKIIDNKRTSRVPEGLQNMLKEERKMEKAAAEAAAKEMSARKKRVPFSQNSEETDPSVQNRYNNIGQFVGFKKILDQSKKTVTYTDATPRNQSIGETAVIQEHLENIDSNQGEQSIDITVLWLALSEECDAMANPKVQRLYVAYSFLGRSGAELETPISLPKPKHYTEKCYFNFRKTFYLNDADLPLLGHMSRCRAGRAAADPRDCVVFSVVSEPPEDPLGLSSCEDIGYAYLYLGDILAYSAGGAGYTEVVPVRAAGAAARVCGVLAVRLDGLHVLRRCLTLSHSSRDIRHS